MNYEALRERMRRLDSKTWRRVRRAAEAGNAEAQFLLGYRIKNTRLDWDGCGEWMHAAAMQDHPEALFELAFTHFDSPVSWGSHNLDEQRYEWLMRSAELGFVRAQREIAVLYIRGDSPFFEKDWAKARVWYLRAAEKGHLESMIAGGSMMARGDGGPADHEKGVTLLERAANGPDPEEAQAAAGELALLYSGAFGFPEDSEKAAEWKRKSRR